MKNRGIMILAAFALILTVILMTKGIQIGALNIKSIKQLIETNKQTNSEIEEVARLTSIDYEQASQTLDETGEDLTRLRDKYYDLVETSSDSGDKIYETEEYDIEYLWTIIGRYATQRNLVLGMDVVKTGEYFNLEFSLKGTYNNISKFITQIENDSELHFRIYDFKLVPGVKLLGGSETEDTKRLQANFSVKEIKLNKKSMTTIETSASKLKKQQNTNSTNNSTTAGNNTTNTTTSTANDTNSVQ